MKTLNLKQGSPEWHHARLQSFTASEAPAMMGASKYQTRDDLLKLKKTGIAPEVSPSQQALFDRGHAAEASIRPYIEMLIGEELYPVTGSIEIEGMILLASFDGLTMMENIGFEHKLINQELAEKVQRGELDPHYYWQLEQQLLVSHADYIIFVVSDGTDGNKFHMPYYPVPGRREQLIAGWKQFQIDLENYVVPEAETPKAIAEPVETLPAITYSTDFTNTGLHLRSNIDAFKAAALRLVEQSKKTLETDQDFANAEARIKSCKAAEEKIAAIQSNVVGEVADIDKFVKDLGAIAEMLRQCRLNEDRQVKARKESIKLEELTRASNEWNAVIVGYNEKLWQQGKVQMPPVHVDFQGAIKGLKTITSLRSKLNDELARGKIEAARVYDQITGNLQLLNMIAGEYIELFADLQNLCTKDADYIKAIAEQRVNAHKAAEQARIQAEAKRIAEEQLMRDRQAEEARQREMQQQAAQQQAPAPQEPVSSVTALNTPARFTRAEQDHLAVTTEQASIFDSPEPMVDLSDYQQGRRDGIIDGLDLALAIFMKNGAADFAKVVEDFIEVGIPEEMLKAA